MKLCPDCQKHNVFKGNEKCYFCSKPKPVKCSNCCCFCRSTSKKTQLCTLCTRIQLRIEKEKSLAN